MQIRRRAALALLFVGAGELAVAQEPSGPLHGPLTVGGAARAAVERSGAARIARERSAQAYARVAQRRADLLPSLSGSIGSGARTVNSAGLGISAPALFDPHGQVLGPVRITEFRLAARAALADPSALARLRASRASADATDADAEAVLQQSAAVAALACVAAMRGDAHLAARVADSALAADLLDIARHQLAAGVGIALDVTRAESQLASARSQLIAARSSRARARIELARAIGLPGDAPIEVGEGLAAASDATAPAPEADASERALQRRADLHAVARQFSAAEHQLRAVGAERLPALTAFADDGAMGASTNRLLNTWSWGVQASVPIFDGLRREGRIAEHRAAVRELDLRRRDLTDQVEADVLMALLDLTAAREQVRTALERERLATQEVTQARDRFSSGVASNADVIVASLNLNAARTFLVDARAALLGARVALARSQGTVTDLP